nr:pyridoxal-dependent decarboxylase [uncultured Flavobacterium sp.]
MDYWKKLSREERLCRITDALGKNVNFAQDPSLGYPASKLDGRVFNDDAPFLKDSPTLQAFVANPNHIGCHTLGTSEKAFKGTQDIEREVLNVIAVDVFKAPKDSFDGYIAPGGTEANIQALWIYRNYFIKNFGATISEIAIIASEDTHYSIPKGADLLMIDWLRIPVDFETRAIAKPVLESIVADACKKGKKYFIVVANMGTTMFGSVDDITLYTCIFEQLGMPFKLHVDAAYGGFIYPFSNTESKLNFDNPYVSSVTIDAHKMLQAPYGTGIFICRKGLIENVLTKEAEYVEGMDLTLCGSRSGANAVAVWMILFTYGAHTWFEKISVLQMRTEWFCRQLDQLGIRYFRNPFMNIVTIKAEGISEAVAQKFDLVPQKHDHTNQWYKIIVMDHVEIEHLSMFIETLRTEKEAVPR